MSGFAGFVLAVSIAASAVPGDEKRASLVALAKRMMMVTVLPGEEGICTPSKSGAVEILDYGREAMLIVIDNKCGKKTSLLIKSGNRIEVVDGVDNDKGAFKPADEFDCSGDAGAAFNKAIDLEKDQTKLMFCLSKQDRTNKQRYKFDAVEALHAKPRLELEVIVLP